MAESREIGTPLPTDVEAPKMYTNGTYILGGIVVLAIITLGILAGILKEDLPNEIVTAFVALGSPAVAGLASIYNRKAG
jgi:uncharacterized membrane protein